VNAWRLAHGVEKSTHAATTPELVWTIEKGFELVCESIPGSILLTHQMLSSLRSSGTFSKAALASVLVSALATGFTSAFISSDFDRSPSRRRDEPDFYGYVLARHTHQTPPP
jgi:hypothetical protein